MNRIIIYILLIGSSLSLQAQQDLGLHFMRDIHQSNLTNPAIFSKYKINVNLPSAFAHLSNSGFSLNDISRMEGNTLLIDLNQVMDQLDDTRNSLQGNAALQTLGIGVQFDKWSISLGHAVKFNNNFNYPKSMLDLFWNGNGAKVGVPVSIAPDFNFSSYQELALGIGYKLNNFLSIGARFKYLNGLGTIATGKANASIYTDSEYYQITAETDFTINSAGIPITLGEGNEWLSVGEFNPQVFGNNKGFAVDLGATFRAGDRLIVTASILDIGQINWNESTTNLTSRGSFEFEGLDFQALTGNGEVAFSELTDSLKSAFQFSESNQSFSTTLPSRFFVSGTLQFGEGMQAGALIYGESFQQQLSPALALSFRKEFGHLFSAGAVYGIRNRSFDNFGINMALRLAGIQFYAMTDNIISVINPMASKSANVRLGLNLAFGKPKTEIE